MKTKLRRTRQRGLAKGVCEVGNDSCVPRRSSSEGNPGQRQGFPLRAAQALRLPRPTARATGGGGGPRRCGIVRAHRDHHKAVR
jgi:hypothetical protein